MEKAKAAVSDFMSKSGHHDTTVHETVAPAVQNEVVKPHVHEEINTAIDKEVHQVLSSRLRIVKFFPKHTPQNLVQFSTENSTTATMKTPSAA
jgi:hypothetical protein